MSVFIFGSGNNNPRTINFTNADITVGYQYFVTGSNKTVITTGSTLAALGYLHSDFTTYNKVINNAKDAGNFSIFNCSFSTFTFLNSTPGSAARIHDNNTADTIRFMSSGSIGSSNTVKVIIGAGGISTGNNNILDSDQCHRRCFYRQQQYSNADYCRPGWRRSGWNRNGKHDRNTGNMEGLSV